MYVRETKVCIMNVTEGAGFLTHTATGQQGAVQGGTRILQVHVQILKDFYWKNAPNVLLPHVSWSLTWDFQTSYQVIYGDLWPLFR